MQCIKNIAHATAITLATTFAASANETSPYNCTVQSEVAQRGVASLYGDKFQGRLTKTEERFDQRKLTAATNTFPMGSFFEVTNLQNGQTVIVKGNDTGSFDNPQYDTKQFLEDFGPEYQKRVVDLSKAAAETLGYDDGLVPVEIRLCETTSPYAVDKSPRPKERPLRIPTQNLG